MAIPDDQFWHSNYYGHPPLTNVMLADAESLLGVRLPEEYVRLLRVQNGGYTHGFAFPMTQRTTWADDHVPLNDMSGIVTDPAIRTHQNILQSAYMTEEWGLPSRQVLLSGDGHWWIALDYRHGPAPTVAWIDVECGEDIQVAPSFGAFLAGLVFNSEFEFEPDET